MLGAALRCIAVICCGIIDIIRSPAASAVPWISDDVLKIDCKKLFSRKFVLSGRSRMLFLLFSTLLQHDQSEILIFYQR